MSESINRSKKSKLLVIKSSSPFFSPRHVDLEGEGIVSLCSFVNAYRSQCHVVVNLIFKVFEKIVSCIRFIIPYALTLQPKAWMGRPFPPIPARVPHACYGSWIQSAHRTGIAAENGFRTTFLAASVVRKQKGSPFLRSSTIVLKFVPNKSRRKEEGCMSYFPPPRNETS